MLEHGQTCKTYNNVVLAKATSSFHEENLIGSVLFVGTLMHPNVKRWPPYCSSSLGCPKNTTVYWLLDFSCLFYPLAVCFKSSIQSILETAFCFQRRREDLPQLNIHLVLLSPLGFTWPCGFFRPLQIWKVHSFRRFQLLGDVCCYIWPKISHIK